MESPKGNRRMNFKIERKYTYRDKWFESAWTKTAKREGWSICYARAFVKKQDRRRQLRVVRIYT